MTNKQTSKISLDQIKTLRAKTKAGVMDCRKALEENEGDPKKAEEWLRKKGISRAAKRAERETAEGLIEAYTHAGGRIVGVVELLCETDFVARTDDFKQLAHELAMQVAAMKPKDVKELLDQEYIREPQKKIASLVKETVGRLGENIKVGRVARWELGE